MMNALPAEEVAPLGAASGSPAPDVPPVCSGDVVTYLVELVSVFARANRTLSEEIEHLRQYRRLAHRDGLTSLCNRRYLDERLPQEIARTVRHGRALAVVMIDLDGLTAVNDRAGHAAGDGLLVRFSDVLRSHLRNDDVVCRYGGDEFCIVMPETTGAQACEVLDRLRRALAERDVLPGGACARGVRGALIAFSAGVAEHAAGMTAASLVARADTALYDAKRAGRDRTVVAPNTDHPAAKAHPPRLSLAQ